MSAVSIMAEQLPNHTQNSIVQLHQQFHPNHGTLVQLSENCLSAFRLRPSHEFNQGLVFSSRPLRDDQVFEVRIDRKVHSWTGSLQIGVTTRDPSTFQPAPPPNALDVVNKSWVLSGCNLFENGKIVVEDYGPDLDELSEGDRVGVMRTPEGDLVFYVNSFAQGVAMSGIPDTVYALVDLYGKCVQTTVMNRSDTHFQPRPLLTLSPGVIETNVEEEPASAASTPSSSLQDRLRFHHRCGSMVKLSNGQRTGERRRPLDEFNNGVVMTQRPLLPDELFEIRIDSLVDKWSGSIEVGITTHNPAALNFPSTMTNLRSGTIMMSGCGILTNGKGTRREYGQCNLDELQEGDRIGLVRKTNGDLHFFVNGRDQGIAASNVPQPVWGVVDLYGRTVKVSLIDREDATKTPDEELDANTPVPDPLLFHPRCGMHAAVVSGGTTAHRPNAQSDFNHGVVLTSRPLKPNELFEVVLDRVVTKWAGSIEIGVTTLRPEELDYPATMTNVRSGTWMMTGNGVMHNGMTVLDDYGKSLDRLGTGDRVGVVRRANGVLHFFVNGQDQGPAAGHVPDRVFGVVDLYGQAAQVSVIDHSPLTPLTDSSPCPSYLYAGAANQMAPLVSPTSLADSTYALPTSPSSQGSSSTLIHTDLNFHRLHGRNTTLANNGLTACRPNALSEFNDAICITSRPLRPGEMFQVAIEKLVERWSGSLELGVTAIRPENLDFPSTMTDIDYETWMLSGSSIMQDGNIVRNGYPLDLDTLQEGNRVGLLRHANGSLHYYLNDQDLGPACWNVPQEVYAVIDLYGQCAQVSIVHKPLQSVGISPRHHSDAGTPLESAASELASSTRSSQPPPAHLEHRLLPACGRSVTLSDDGRSAVRDDKDFENGLVFSARPLLMDETFDVCIEAVSSRWSGSLAIGVTAFYPQEGAVIPGGIEQLDSAWYVSQSDVVLPGGMRWGPCTPLEHLAVGDVLSVQRTSDATIRFALNGRDLDVAIRSVPLATYAVVDLHGPVLSISVKSASKASSAPESPSASPAGAPGSGAAASGSLPMSLSQLAMREALQGIQSALSSRFANAFNHQQRFHPHHGRNVSLKNNGQTAQRTASYNQGLVYSKEPVAIGGYFQVKIDELDDRWSGSLMLGVTSIVPDKTVTTPPTCALLLKRCSWVVSGRCVHHGGRKVRADLAFDLDELRAGQSAGVLLTTAGHLHVLIDGEDCGPVAWVGTAEPLFAVVDLYGQVSQVSTLAERSEPTSAAPAVHAEEKALRESSSTEKNRSEAKSQSSRSCCSYKQACLRFIRFMGVPDGFFESDSVLCGCEGCYRAQSETADKLEADLRGWCRWPIKSRAKPDKKDAPAINEKWQRAYHGSRLNVVRRVLDHGHLLPPDLKTWQRAPAARRSAKDHDGESRGQLLFSPVLQASIAPLSEYFDPVLKMHLGGQVVFQVLIKPGSYKVRRATSPLNGPSSSVQVAAPCGTAPLNPDAGNQLLNASAESGIEEAASAVFWYTKERGAAIVQALLVKLDDVASLTASS